ncbi:MAG TPA: glycosyltransferase [Acidobacteriota bacterium]|nr:glycosyltransferase [Acidobacteriota bacterium]HNJ39577.1 glycosyltransferase [Acidobacteriota bacterium]
MIDNFASQSDLTNGVSIVIPSFNGQHLLKQFLPSVIEAAEVYEHQSGAPTEIIIVDDGSQDETVNWLTRHFPGRVLCLPQIHNRGFSPTCNIGFAAAQYPLIWLLNNDIEATPTALTRLVSHFQNPDVFAVGSRAYRLSPDLKPTTEIDGAGRVGELVRGFWKVYRSYDLLPEYDRQANQPLFTMMASGGYVLFDATKLKRVGGFEELLAPFYWEDAELCYRAWKRGWQVLYEPESLVYHQSSATIPKHFEARTVNVIAMRNRMIMHWIHLHDPWMWLLHLGMTGLLLVRDLISGGKYQDLQAFQQVWQMRKKIWQRRQAERQSAIRTDREILELLKEVTQRQGVMTYKNADEYASFLEKTRQADDNVTR